MQGARAQTIPTTLPEVLTARKAALSSLHVRDVSSVEVFGSIEGAGLTGSFRRWESGADSRQDDEMASHAVQSLQIGDKQYLINESGDVRELHGVLARRSVTDAFINGDGFYNSPQYEKFLGKLQLPDGRGVFGVVVQPPGGQAETVYLDQKTFMIDRISYDEDDGLATQDYYDYRVMQGALIAMSEVESNGDRSFDVSHNVRRVLVNTPIAPSVFAVPQSNTIQTDKPVTVPITNRLGHWYVQVQVGDKSYNFLIDTGAQMIAIDSHVAGEQHLLPEGTFEVAGARRTGGLGFASLDAISIGGTRLPVHSVSVLDLHDVAGADGVLGYPFFGSAEVTIDPVGRTMTFAKPGTLHPQGTEFDVDTDRQLVEMEGAVNQVNGTFVVDTGDSAELLLYAPFMAEHPDVVPLEDRMHPASDYGVGGSTRAAFGYVDDLDFGPFHMFNRYANIIESDRGAFADRFDAGNIGMGVLQNFVVTFDEADGKMYVVKSSAFDDGRLRRRSVDPGNMFQ